MRTRTRPDVKWLINEAAVLAGELQRTADEISRLERHRIEVEQAHRACLQTLAIVVQEMPALMPVVRERRPYGGRGALRRLLLDALRNVAPKALDTNQLTQLAVEGLSLSFPSPAAFIQFKKGVVARTLRYFVEQGRLERVHIPAPGPTTVGYWRWKAELPTITELAEGAGSASLQTIE